jgi:hypothetical protein
VTTAFVAATTTPPPQNSSIHDDAMMYGFTQVSESPHNPFLRDDSLPAFEQDLASFLLVRGPYAWLGYGWMGCGSDSSCQYGKYARPEALELDYGTPVDEYCIDAGAGTINGGAGGEEGRPPAPPLPCKVG